MLMSAEADALCGAGYRERSPERTNTRNGYRERAWDTRVGTIEVAIPKLREGSYYPTGCSSRGRAEPALVCVVADAYLAGVSTRRVEELVAQLGMSSASLRPGRVGPPGCGRPRSAVGGALGGLVLAECGRRAAGLTNP